MKMKLMFSIVAMLLVSVFAVSAVPDLEIINQQLSLTKNPGDVATFSFTLQNNLAEEMDVTFNVENLVLGSNTINMPSIGGVHLEVYDGVTGGLDEKTITFDITVPGSKLAGDYEGGLTATGTYNSSTTTPVPADVTLTINSVPAYTLSVASVTLTTPSDNTMDYDVTVTNTGSEELTTFSAAYTGDVAQLEDDDNDWLTYTFDLPTSILPGATDTFTINVEVDKGMDIDTYNGQVTLTANGETRDVLVYTKVMPRICEDGKVGNLKVSIDDPDDGDKYKPGEEIEIDVDVDNNDDDDIKVEVEAIFYNLDEDDELKSVVSNVEKIRNDKSESFTLKMILPTSDFDEEDTFYLYVKAYKDGNEDDHCDYDSIEIDMERDDVDVIITDVVATPASAYPGDRVHFAVEVENIGLDAQEEVIISVNEPEMDLKASSPRVDLQEYDDSDNDYRWEFTYDVPEDLVPGDYYIEVKVEFDDGDEYDTKLFTLTVLGDEDVESSSSVSAVTGGAVAITPAVDTINLAEGQTKFTIEMLLENKDKEPSEFSLDVTEYSSWADVLGMEVPSKLYPGDKYHAYVYMELKDDAQPGVHNFRVNTRNGDALLSSKLLGVNVPGQASEEVVAEETGKVREFFNNKSKIFWLIGDLVLIVLAVFFIRMLFKK